MRVLLAGSFVMSFDQEGYTGSCSIIVLSVSCQQEAYTGVANRKLLQKLPSEIYLQALPTESLCEKQLAGEHGQNLLAKNLAEKCCRKKWLDRTVWRKTEAKFLKLYSAATQKLLISTLHVHHCTSFGGYWGNSTGRKMGPERAIYTHIYTYIPSGVSFSDDNAPMPDCPKWGDSSRK